MSPNGKYVGYRGGELIPIHLIQFISETSNTYQHTIIHHAINDIRVLIKEIHIQFKHHDVVHVNQKKIVQNQ